MTAVVRPAVEIMVHRDAAWAIAGAASFVALLSLIGVILAWRAVRKTRRALRILEDLSRRPTQPLSGPRLGTRQVPVMVTPETVFPPPERIQPAPADAPSREALEDRPAAQARVPDEQAPSRFQRPPPDIARYEVRFPGHPREDPGASEGVAASGPEDRDEPDDRAAPEDIRLHPAVETSPQPEPQPEPQASPEPQPAPEPEVDETEVLLQAARSADPFVRSKAVEGLRGRPQGERAALDALDDDYPIVRRSAVRALRATVGSRAAQALVGVVSHDPSAEVREEAVVALADLLNRGANENS
jgi:hypothetical protein